MPDHADILRQIQGLLDAGQTPALDELEDTLTSGYAAALGDGEGGRTQELARLGQRLSVAADDLARLRSMLGTLRDRADAARAAA